MGENNMEGEPDVTNVLSHRSPVLEALLDGPKTTRDLVAHLDTPRSTVRRAVRELEDADLAERTANGYRATLTGRLALGAHETYLAAVETYKSARAVLVSLPRDAPIELSIIRGATVHAAESHAPVEPVRHAMKTLDGATVVRGILPVVLPLHLRKIRMQVATGDLGGELVVSPDVADTLASRYPDVFGSLLSCETFTLLEATTELPFELVVAEGDDARRVVVVSYGRHGPAGVILNDRDRAVTWAESTYEHFSRNATPIQPE